MARNLMSLVTSLCLTGAITTAVSSADLNAPSQNQNEQPTKIPATSEFSSGPQGGGAVLSEKDRAPSSTEFSTGPQGGATQVPSGSEKRIPSSSEFSSGPVGTQK